MGARFRRDSSEEMCGKTVVVQSRAGKSDGACMRIVGHAPPCIAWAGKAADADRVCHWCRAPNGEPHRYDCEAVLITQTNVIIMVEEWPKNPCGHKTRHNEGLAFHYNNYVVGVGIISECPQCGATWDDV